MTPLETAGSDEFATDGELFDHMKDEMQRDNRDLDAQIAQAKRQQESMGKEPFDARKFLKLRGPDDTFLTPPQKIVITSDLQRDLERQYYLVYPESRTILDFLEQQDRSRGAGEN